MHIICFGKHHLGFCLVGLALAMVSGAANAGPPVFPYHVERSELANGLVVLSVKYDSPGIIAYYTVVRTGSRNEVEPGRSGFAHFFEHMMFRGTKKFPEEKYNDVLKTLGADSNAFTTDDWTCYHMTIPASSLATAVELESDRFQNLFYDQPAFQKEARAVLGEYNKGASSPFQILNETIQDKAYSKHTYKHTTIGFLADVKDMPNQYAYSRTFFDRWYKPENCTLIVVGDVDHAGLMKLVSKAYGTWSKGKAGGVLIPVEAEQKAEQTAQLAWPSPTLPIVNLAYHIPSADPKNADWPALSALAQSLFGDTSPLYKALVLDEQKVELLLADAERKRDPGLFQVMALVRDPANVVEVRRRIEQTLAEAATKPVDSKKLGAIKSHMRYAFASSLDRPDSIALVLGESIAITGRIEAIDQLYESYDDLTPGDLQRVAEKYFNAANRTVVTLESKAK